MSSMRGDRRARWGRVVRLFKLGGLAIGAAVGAASAPTAALAQVPNEEWRTLATEHFRVTFPERLESIAKLPALRHLYLWKTNVTEEGVGRLQAARPGLEVVLGRAPIAAPAEAASEDETKDAEKDAEKDEKKDAEKDAGAEGGQH